MRPASLEHVLVMFQTHFVFLVIYKVEHRSQEAVEPKLIHL